MRKLRQMGKMQKFGMLTYIYCIFGTSVCIYLEFGVFNLYVDREFCEMLNFGLSQICNL